MTIADENKQEALELAKRFANIGYGIYNVSIQDTEMPRDDVANAFKAVEDAKQGMETAINSAKKYQSENIPEAKAKADKLLQFTIDIGGEERTIVSGIRSFYKEPAELIGKKLVVLANLAPKKIRGIMSHGMILTAASDDDSVLEVLQVGAEAIQSGASIS